MQSNMEPTDLADLATFGQTGVLTSDTLYSFGCLLDSLRDRVAKIANHKAKVSPSRYDYEADEETVTITSSGFEVRMSYYDRCDRYEHNECGYVSFTDVLDQDIMDKIDAEIKEAAAKRLRDDLARKAAATQKANAATEEKAAFERFKQWEKDHG